MIRGKETLAKVKVGNIVINFDDLFSARGEKESSYLLEKRASTVFSVISFLLFVVPIAVTILSGNFNFEKFLFPSDLIHYIPYLSLFTGMFSLYLSRDRDKLDNSLKQYNLQKVSERLFKGENINLEIDKYFNFKLEAIIDNAYFNDNNNFILSLLNELLKLDEIVYLITVRLGLDLNAFKAKLVAYQNKEEFNFNLSYRNLFLYLFDEAVKLDLNSINEDVLLFVLNKYFLKPVFLDLNISDLELEGVKIWFKNESKRREYYKIWEKLSKLKPTGDVNRAYTSRATPMLDQYAEDFTSDAARGFFMLSIGKEQEMRRVTEVLERESRSAVIILGEPGVGKTRFIRYLATKMTVEDVPKSLHDYRLVVVDLNKILTKTASIDSFKSNLQSMFEEVRISGNIILVLEEFSQILNIRDDARLEVVNLIVNAIDALKLQIIATSNYSNYTKYIQPNKSLAALFEVIKLNEPSSNVALQILIDEVPRLEKKHGLNIQVSALKRIVEFSSKFDFERVMPDKGIDLLEEACVRAKSELLKFVDINLVDKLLTDKIGVNVGSISQGESEVLLTLGDVMHKRVVGQEDAINAIVSAVKRSRSGLTNSKRPIASFMFFGPTGVGKTEVAKTLADVYYGNEKLMARIDMSEYQEEQNLNRLIGYTDEQGNFIGGYLTEAVRSRPFSLVLLDEVEKANKKVLDLFLQVLDEGSITDGAGRKIDFTNTIIIMTSNVGSKRIADLIIKGYKYSDVEKEVLNDLRDFFRIEFLNRFDKLIMFKPLSKLEIQEIVRLTLEKINENLLTRGISIAWNDKTLAELAEMGYNPVYGARELRRVVQEQIEDKLADLIISGNLKSGSEAVLDGLNVAKLN